MCDFAPRTDYDFRFAMAQFIQATTGLYGVPIPRLHPDKSLHVARSQSAAGAPVVNSSPAPATGASAACREDGRA